MAEKPPEFVFELASLRGRTAVFRDRTHAGEVLAGMLAEQSRGQGCVVAIPAGGVPVGAELAERLGLPLEVAAVSKLTPPWNSEVGFGAVAFDGTLYVQETIRRQFGLSDKQVQAAVAETHQKIRRRLNLFHGDAAPADLAGKEVLLTDDGLASGITMCVAVRALQKAGAARITVAVPTAHEESIGRLIGQVDAVYCANIRSGWHYAVADAYHHWRDISEADAAAIFRDYTSRFRAADSP